jgi:hypothetical protein
VDLGAGETEFHRKIAGKTVADPQDHGQRACPVVLESQRNAPRSAPARPGGCVAVPGEPATVLVETRDASADGQENSMPNPALQDGSTRVYVTRYVTSSPAARSAGPSTCTLYPNSRAAGGVACARACTGSSKRQHTATNAAVNRINRITPLPSQAPRESVRYQPGSQYSGSPSHTRTATRRPNYRGHNPVMETRCKRPAWFHRTLVPRPKARHPIPEMNRCALRHRRCYRARCNSQYRRSCSR